jgi:hypothetical protein
LFADNTAATRFFTRVEQQRDHADSVPYKLIAGTTLINDNIAKDEPLSAYQVRSFRHFCVFFFEFVVLSLMFCMVVVLLLLVLM